MKINKKEIKMALLLVLSFVVLFAIIISLLFFQQCNMENIDGGEFIESISSPNNDYLLNAYFIDGGPISGDGIRVELVNKKTNRTKNIYYDYPVSNVSMEWIDDHTVKINDYTMNIYKDTYNWACAI